MRKRPILWLAAALVASCARSPEPEKSASEPVAEAIAPATRARSVPGRDVAVLVVRDAAGALTVLSATRVPAADLGAARNWSGSGRPTHRWTLVGSSGETLASGPIAARWEAHLPADPRRGADAATTPLSATTFTVRADWPEAGEAIEIASVAPGAAMRWQP